MIYPIGSIYISVSSTNPGTLFSGTTWSQLKDRFLLGLGDIYKTVNDTGGSSTVTLTTAQIPSHNHTLGNHTHTYAHSNGTSGSTTLTVAQIPSHSHLKFAFGSWGSSTENKTRITADVYVGKDQGNPQYEDGTQNVTGSTGGSKGHTHSVGTYTANTGANNGTTGSSGSGNSHNNMPPYLVVYMWKRTK